MGESTASVMLAPICSDKSVTFKKQWYRFYGAGGTQILTSPSALSGYANVCTRDRAGWLSGEHPALGEEPVTRKICFPRSGQDCQYTVEAQVVACGEGMGTSSTCTSSLPHHNAPWYTVLSRAQCFHRLDFFIFLFLIHYCLPRKPLIHGLHN